MNTAGAEFPGSAPAQAQAAVKTEQNSPVLALVRGSGGDSRHPCLPSPSALCWVQGQTWLWQALSMTGGWGWWGHRDPTPEQRSQRSQTRPGGWRADTSGLLPAETPQSCLQTGLTPALSGWPWVHSVAPSQTHPACTSSLPSAPYAWSWMQGMRPGQKQYKGQSLGTLPRFSTAQFSTWMMARTASAQCH